MKAFTKPARLHGGVAALIIGWTLFANCAAKAADVPLGKADIVVVLKSQRVLELLRSGMVIKTYRIALGRHPVGPKKQLGDGKTPEGSYVINGRTTRTPYHLALHISYPDALDRARARAAGVAPGGGIFIHGMPGSYGPFNLSVGIKDWTDGCIAVGDVSIEEIWNAVDNGTPIEIKP